MIGRLSLEKAAGTSRRASAVFLALLIAVGALLVGGAADAGVTPIFAVTTTTLPTAGLGNPYFFPLQANEGQSTAPVVAIRGTSDNLGYWVVDANGDVYTFGDAVSYGSLSSSPSVPISGMAATSDGKGYWLVDTQGNVYSFGDAVFHGSTQQLNPVLPAGGTNAVSLAAPISGMAATPDGNGYWLVGSDGGVFSFGDANFSGSEGGQPLSGPVTGMAVDSTSTVNGWGYWLADSNGTVYNFGSASSYGSVSSPSAPIVSIAASSDGAGYWLVGGSGVVDAGPTAGPAQSPCTIAGGYGDACYEGSVGNQPYTWTASSGSLPAGLSLSAGGIISGTATALGTSTFTVTVTDSNATPNTTSATVSITVAALGWNSASAFNGMPMSGIACPSASTCVSVGKGLIDAFSPSNPDLSPSVVTVPQQLNSVSCPSTSQCFAVGYGVIDAFSPTNLSPTVYSLPLGAPLSLYGVSCPSTSQCFAVGYGVIDSFPTTNLSPTIFTVPQDLNSVSCPSTSECFAVGSQVIDGFTSTNLSPIPLTVSQYLNSVSCPSTSQCFAVGDGVIDAFGITYTSPFAQALSPNAGTVPAGLVNVDCYSAMECFAAGFAGYPNYIGNGIAFATTDGGASWYPQDSMPFGTLPLDAIACASSANCVTGSTWGGGGNLLFTGNGGLGNPTPPPVVTATAGVLSANLTWQPPVDAGGGPDTFTVSATPSCSSCTGLGPVSGTSTNISGLMAGTNYSFTVIAANGAGSSASSPVSNSVIPQAPPAPPPPPPTSTTSLSLSSSASSLAPGSSATFTATVTTTTTKSGTTTTTPDAGSSVSFDVSSGPDAGKTASGVTDASGVATFTYVNNGTSGTDQVTATASGASGMATAIVSFTGQYTLTLASSAPGSDEGTPVSLTATLTDPSGASVTGGAISFTITGPDAASSTSVATGSSGTAVLTLDATTTGTDSVSASYTTPASPSAPASILTSNTVTVKWAAPATIAPTSSPTGTSPGSPSNPLPPGQQISLSVIVTQSAPAAIKFHFGTFPTQSWFGFSFVSSRRPSHSDTTSAPAFFPLSSYPHATTVPAVGVPVVFAVSAGPDAGQGATVNTDSTGTATWTYSGTGAGTDAVGATFTDSAGVAHTAHFAVSWSTTATTTTSSTSTSSTSTTVAPTTTATTVPPTPTTTAPTRSVPPGYVAPPAPTPIVFSPVATTPTPTPGSSTSPTTAPTTTSTTLKSTSTTAVKKAPSSQSHAKSSSNRATSTTLSPQALGVTSTGGVVSVDGVTNNSNGNDVPPAAVKALVAAGQSGPAMPFNKGYGLGAGGGPPGPAPLARSIPTPTQALHAIKKTVKSNGLLSFLLIFLIGLPAIAFNAALKEHHASLASSHGALRRLVDSVESRLENLHGAVLLVAFAVIGSVLYALDDPAFGFNLGSLAEIVGYVGAILVSTTATEVLRGVYVHRRFQKVGDLRAFPLGIVVAIVFDAFSRLSHFEPGYVFGILAAIVFRVKPTGEEDGRSMTYASMWLLGLAVASWFAFGVVNGAVIAGNHHFWMLAAESLLSYVWICGLQSLFFGLIPARYMDGDAIFSWSKIAWAALYLVVTFTFVQFILHPTTSGFGGNKNTNLFSMLAIFIVSAVAGLTFWLYSHLRFGRTRGPGLEMVSLGEE